MKANKKWEFNIDSCEFDRGVLSTLIEVFDEMIEDPDEIDFSRYDLNTIEELVKINDQLKDYLRDSSLTVKIPRQYFDIWVMPWLNHVEDIDLDEERDEMMNDIYLDFLRASAKWRDARPNPS